MIGWLVTFRGQLDDDARGAIMRAGFTLTGSHGVGVSAAGGILPPMTSHTVRVEAETPEAAESAVREVVEPLGLGGVVVDRQADP